VVAAAELRRNKRRQPQLRAERREVKIFDLRFLICDWIRN
jgi:hypothetical protein